MRHAFVSYVRQDAALVDRLCGALTEAGVEVWVDRNDILPGVRWRQAIRKAISEGDYFLACFSPNYLRRNATYMNEELNLAISLLRTMPADRAWFIPIILEECEVPDREIGAGETLGDIQQVHLYRDWQGGVQKILAVIKPSPRTAKVAQAAEVSTPLKILFVASDAQTTTKLRLDAEQREVRDQVARSKRHVILDVRTAVRPSDLLQALLGTHPNIIHFAGSGTPPGELLLEDDQGEVKAIRPDSLTTLLASPGQRFDCIVFNSCFSLRLARAVISLANYSIGFEGHLDDRGAISFAVGFYLGLGDGMSVADSFQMGRSSMLLEGRPKEESPVLIKSESIKVHE